MPQGIGAQFQPNISLKQDFGQSPIGSLGKRSVQQVGAEPPRAQQSGGFVGMLKGLGSRIVSLFQSEGVRAQSEYRGSLEKTSSQVGELIGALSKTGTHIVDGIGAKKILDGLDQTMQPMLSRGANRDEVFQARIELNLKNMSPEQLRSLRDGLAMVKNSALAGDPQIAKIGTALAKELEARETGAAIRDIGGGFREARSRVDLHGERQDGVKLAFNEMLVKAGGILREPGKPEPSSQAKLGLVTDTLDRMLTMGEIEPGDVRAVFDKLPSEDLLSIVTREPTGREIPDSLDDVTRIAVQAVMGRRDSSQAGFDKGLGVISARKEGPIPDPKVFAREVIDTVGHLETHLHHCEVHHLEKNGSIEGKSGELKAKLETLLAPGNLELGSLSDSELTQLGKSLERLGVAAGRGEVAAEITRRKDGVQRAFNDEFQGVAKNLRSGDMKGLVESLKRLSDRGGEALLQHQRLGGRAVLSGENDKLLAVRGNLLKEALKDFSVDELRELQKALYSPEIQKLQAAMGEIALELSHLEVGMTMLDRAVDFENLDGALEATIRAKGGEPVPDVPNNYRREDMTLGVREALRSGFGLEVRSPNDVRPKVELAPQKMQDHVSSKLKEHYESGFKEHVLLDGTKTGVDEGLWLDLGRATYTVSSKGEKVEILDRGGFNQLTTERQDQRRLGAIETLKTTGASPEALKMLSRVWNQNIFAGVEFGLYDEESPLREPDTGAPGRLVGKTRAEYDVCGDGQGGLVLDLCYGIEGGHRFQSLDGSPSRSCNPNTSRAEFTFQVRIDKDGNVTMKEPVRFESTIEQTDWKHDYPQPRDVLEAAVGRGDLQTAFREFAGRQFIMESVDFLNEHSSFMEKPTLEGARALARRFIGDSAPDQVNIDAVDARRILEKLSGAGSETLTPDQLRDVFDKPFTEVCGMLRDGPFKAFVRENGGKI